MERTMTADESAKTFNEWMRRFTEEPEKFRREFEEVTEFLAEQAEGKEPSYGQECAEYQYRILDDMKRCGLV